MKKARRGYTRYSPEFKKRVIMDMREHNPSCHETVRKYWQTKTHAETDSFRKTVRNWERKYLEEGEAGLMEESRKRTARAENPDAVGRKEKPLPAEAGGDLAAENRRLRERNLYLEAENAYLKKLDALARAEAERSGARPGRCPN